MKRIALLVALAVIFALAAPAMAGPYSDVPASHWAYDALNKLAATGIVTGYPDGTYKGNNNLTRYQIAVLVSRVLDAVEAETELLNEKVEAVENGLTAGQAEDVIAIFKSLIAKYAPEGEAPMQDSLTANQAEEVAGIVEALSLEFKFELEALGADVDGMLDRMEAVEDRIAKLETTTIGGTYELELLKTAIEGDAYTDPFDTTSDEYTADDDVFRHKLGLDISVVKDPIVLDVNMVLAKDVFGTWSEDSEDDHAHDFDNSDFSDTFGFDIDTINATLTTDALTANVGEDQEVILTDYLLGDADEKVSGVVVNAGGSTYVLARNKQAVDDDKEKVMSTDTKNAAVAELAKTGLFADPADFFELKDDSVIDPAEQEWRRSDAAFDLGIDETQYKYLEENYYSVYRSITYNSDDDKYELIPADVDEDFVESYDVHDVLAVQQDLGLLNSKLFVGVNNLFEDDFVVGVDSQFDIMGAEIKTSVAMSDKEDDDDETILARIAASRELGPVAVSGGFRKIDKDFSGILADIDDKPGYDVNATLPLGPLTFDGSYTHIIDHDEDDPNENIMKAGVTLEELNLVGFDITGNFEQEMRNRDYEAADDTEAERQKRNVEVSRDLILGMAVTAGYEYDMYTDYEEDPVYGHEDADVATKYDVVGADHQEYRYNIYDSKLTADVWDADDEENNVYANLNWDMFIPGLTSHASYEWDIENEAQDTLEFGADFVYSIFNVGVDLDVEDKETVVEAGVNPDAYNLFDIVAIDTEANFEMLVPEDEDGMIKYGVGIDLIKEIDALAMKAGYTYVNNEIDNVDDDEIVGKMSKITGGLDYALTADLKANLTYENIQVYEAYTYEEDKTVVGTWHEVPANSHVQQIKAGLSYSF